MEDNEVEVNVQINGIDENIAKAEKLVALLKEAKSLADDLAFINFDTNKIIEKLDVAIHDTFQEE